MTYQFFKESEFACPCCGENKIQTDLILKVDRVRGIYMRPMKINSGYRCEKHNMEIGGRPNSAHTRGWAADISVPGNHERFLLIKAAIEEGFVRIEPNVGKAWVHLDMDPSLDQETMF